MPAREGIEVRAAARDAAAATGALPALRSVVLNLCARHGARQILWIGPGGEPLGRALRQAGYAVWGMDPSGNFSTAPTDGAPAPPTGATDLDQAPPLAGVRFDLALSTESPESCAAFGVRVALAAGALRPDGFFLLPIPYRGSLFSRIGDLYAHWQSRHDRSRGGSSWSRPRLQRLLESHGFVLVEVIGVRDASWRLRTAVWVARQGGRPPVAGMVDAATANEAHRLPGTGGRPKRTPCARAARRPARVRSGIGSPVHRMMGAPL